jgi:hypothetical protein
MFVVVCIIACLFALLTVGIWLPALIALGAVALTLAVQLCALVAGLVVYIVAGVVDLITWPFRAFDAWGKERRARKNRGF